MGYLKQSAEVGQCIRLLGDTHNSFVSAQSAVQGTGGGGGNSLVETTTRGVYFDAAASKNVTALLGKTAYLNCRVKNLANRTVSAQYRKIQLFCFGIKSKRNCHYIPTKQ